MVKLYLFIYFYIKDSAWFFFFFGLDDSAWLNLEKEMFVCQTKKEAWEFITWIMFVIYLHI